MGWSATPLARRLGLRVPLIQAPMAGGASTPALAAAVSAAGGLGSLAGAMSTPEQLRAAITEVRSRTGAPFAVNIFAALPAPTIDRVPQWSELTGVPFTAPPLPPDVSEQLAVITDENVAVLSFTFGIVALEGITAFRIGTATTVAEAIALEAAGVDAVVAQGYEAGGHRGTFLDAVDRSLIGTLALVPQIVDAVSIPVIASGGIMDGRAIAAAMALGAQAVQLGTAFLRCPEAGTSERHRRALGADTVVTNVLTGRAARAVRTAAVVHLEAAGLQPPDYPLPRSLSPEPPMLAGQAGALARAIPAGDLVRALAAETTSTIAALST